MKESKVESRKGEALFLSSKHADLFYNHPLPYLSAWVIYWGKAAGKLN